MANFEQALVLVILVMVALVTYFIPQKIAFLNFFYIPVLVAAYYIGPRMASLSAVFTVLMVGIYAWIYPDVFFTMKSNLDLTLSLVVWGSFLTISGIVVGKLTLRLKSEIERVTNMSGELKVKQDELDETSTELNTFVEHLDERVEERTVNIEKSRQVLEDHKKKVEEALYSTMDPTVVKLIIEKRLRTEKRSISVMFSDLKGFTSYSEENRAEVVVTDLNRYLADMEEVLLNYRAHIDKYMGDGIMAEFGAPVDYERYAFQAVLCGMDMQKRMQQSKYPWDMRIGIASGESIIGLTGHKRQSYTTLGDTVNLAARIEGICTPGEVTVDEETYQQTKRYINYKLKTVQVGDGTRDDELSIIITEKISQLDINPESFDLNKEVGFLLLKVNDVNQANKYFAKAMAIKPDDTEVKLAYAESSLKAQEQDSISIRGKSKPIRLYEVTGLKDPLQDRDRIPQILYEQYIQEIDDLIIYPEDILLPVESIEGAVRHSRMVGFLAYVLADKLALPYQTKKDILQAGYFSDYGKSIVSHHILNRRGTLSEDEFSYVVQHPEESTRKLKLIGYNDKQLFEFIESHHENFAGGGYPRGLVGEKIPIGGRIIALAEAYSSLTSWRPYRERWEKSAALVELGKDTKRGKYDPAIMQILREILS